MVSSDDDLPPPPLRHSFDSPPQLVCLDCGKAIFGPIVRPFDLVEGHECEICAKATMVAHGSVFRNYAQMFSK